MVVELTASPLAGDLVGTVAARDDDFSQLEALLGLDGWLILGVAYSLHRHDPRQPDELTLDSSVASEGWARLWAIEQPQVGGHRRLDDIVKRGQRLEVTEFSIEPEDLLLPDLSTAVALLLRSCKHLSLVMWRSIFHTRNISADDLVVTEQRRLVWQHDHYQPTDLPPPL